LFKPSSDIQHAFQTEPRYYPHILKIPTSNLNAATRPYSLLYLV